MCVCVQREMKNRRGTSKTKRWLALKPTTQAKPKQVLCIIRESYAGAALGFFFVVVQFDSLTIVHYASSCDSNLHMNRTIPTTTHRKHLLKKHFMSRSPLRFTLHAPFACVVVCCHFANRFVITSFRQIAICWVISSIHQFVVQCYFLTVKSQPFSQFAIEHLAFIAWHKCFHMFRFFTLFEKEENLIFLVTI